MFNNTTITIDLAKQVFQIAIFNQAGKEKLNVAASAEKIMRIINQYPKAKIYMEACSSAYFWGRKLQSMGYFVGLLPAQIVTNYRNGNKSDKNDALVIFEASKNEHIHPVAIKTLEQQDISLLHTHREGFKKSRNQTANRIRGFTAEYGVYFFSRY